MANITGTGIECPDCGWPCDHIMDSRKREGYVWRRRQCIGCGRRVSTKELSVEEGFRADVVVSLRFRLTKRGDLALVETPAASNPDSEEEEEDGES